MDKLINKAPNDLTDYRIVKLSDGSTLVGSISLDQEFLRIQNPLQLMYIKDTFIILLCIIMKLYNPMELIV